MVEDVDALVAEAGWSMSWFMQSLVNRECVDVASKLVLVRAMVARELGWYRCLLLGEAGDGLQVL